MKKVFAIAAAVVMAAACAGFTACGDSDDNWEITAETDFADIVSDRVTEEEWSAALALENFENYKYYVFTENVNYNFNEVYYSIDGDKLYYKTVGENPTEEYWCLDGSGLGGWRYRFIENEWKKEYYNGSGIAGYFYVARALNMEYSNYEYIEESKGYVLCNTENKEEYIVKFKNGKCCGYICRNVETKTVVLSITIYDYGHASVTLPEVEE